MPSNIDITIERRTRRVLSGLYENRFEQFSDVSYPVRVIRVDGAVASCEELAEGFAPDFAGVAAQLRLLDRRDAIRRAALACGESDAEAEKMALCTTLAPEPSVQYMMISAPVPLNYPGLEVVTTPVDDAADEQAAPAEDDAAESVDASEESLV